MEPKGVTTPLSPAAMHLHGEVPDDLEKVPREQTYGTMRYGGIKALEVS